MFSIANLIGSREAVIKTINETPKVPPAVKAALVESVGTLAPEFTGCKVDAHGQIVSGGLVIHLTVLPLKLAS